MTLENTKPGSGRTTLNTTTLPRLTLEGKSLIIIVSTKDVNKS